MKRGMMPQQSSEETVASSVYTRDYYEAHCDGYAEFQNARGSLLPERLQLPFQIAGLTPGMSALDVGCGRGEIVWHAARLGARAVGFDYSTSAIEIAAETTKSSPDAGAILIHLGNAQRLPYRDGSFDRAFMLDVVEHLHPAELHRAFLEIRRSLRPGGRLIVHTMPNTWYYQVGYPIFRVVQRLRGKRLPADPRDRWKYKEVHVNEQNLIRLRRALTAAGFKAKVWLQSTHSYVEEPNRYIRWAMRALVTIYPFRWVFCDDIFAVAEK